jgi:hypothetical protein
MDVFYIIVLSVAVCLLILILTYIGIKMSNKTSNVTPYPPSALTCPDYWDQTTDSSGNSVCIIPPYAAPGSSVMPANTGSIYGDNGKNNLSATGPSAVAGYSGASGTINFSNSGWNNSGASATCAQKNWANKYGLQWDGISNYNNC